MPVVFEFVYLGSLVHYTCSDEPDVDRRVKKAAAVFGALSKCLFRSRSISLHAKGLAYKTLVLSILLYGSEAWALTRKSWRKLERFLIFYVSTTTSSLAPCQLGHQAAGMNATGSAGLTACGTT